MATQKLFLDTGTCSRLQVFGTKADIVGVLACMGWRTGRRGMRATCCMPWCTHESDGDSRHGEGLVPSPMPFPGIYLFGYLRTNAQPLQVWIEVRRHIGSRSGIVVESWSRQRVLQVHTPHRVIQHIHGVAIVRRISRAILGRIGNANGSSD